MSGASHSAETTAVALADELGFGADTVEVLAGGNQNHAVRLRSRTSDVVLRFARDTRRLTMDPFDVEQWCSGAAAEAGIATPPTVARAHVGGHSVIVQEFVPGAPADASDLQAWAAIGRVAGSLADIDPAGAPDGLFSRFGRDLDAAWLAHLDYNIAALGSGDPLLELGVYDPEQRAALRQILTDLRARPLRQGVSHGDLSTRNLIADTAGGYVVLDWGSAIAGPVPWTDLELIQRWHVTGDPVSEVSASAWQAVLSGAGVSESTADELVPELQILHVLDVIRWALDRRPDRIQEFVLQARSAIPRILS